MRVPITVLCGTLLVAAALPATATTPKVTPPQARIVVTGQRVPLARYLQRGLTLQQARVQAQLDELAHEGLSTKLLTSAAAVSSSTSSDGPPAYVFLEAAGHLGSRRSAVLEERFLGGSKAQVYQYVARDGLTGTVLWTRKDTLTDKGFEVAIPAVVGAKNTDGVILLRASFGGSGGFTTTLIALDGKGKQVWTKTITDSSTSSGSGFSSSGTVMEFGRHVRAGSREIAVVREQVATDSSGKTTGSVAFGAISQATGVGRSVPGGIVSPDGVASGEFVSDQSGDGYDDVVTLDGGSVNRVVLSRGTGGQLWVHDDIALHGFGFVQEVGPLTGAKAGGEPVQDLTLITAPAPGVVNDPLGLVPDPTASKHGTVYLLAGGTGTAVWNKTGDESYAVESVKGQPAVGVASDNSSTTSTDATAALQLDVFDLQGTALWSRSFSLDVPHSATSQDDYAALAFAGAFLDLNSDKGYEGIVVLDVIDFTTEQFTTALHVPRSADGSDIKDVDSGFLGGSVTGSGEDRTQTRASSKGITASVTHGEGTAKLFSRLLPKTAGTRYADLNGSSLTAARCEDVVYSANGRSLGVVGVLASNGQLRWTVARPNKDSKAGMLTAPKTAPKPRC